MYGKQGPHGEIAKWLESLTLIPRNEHDGWQGFSGERTANWDLFDRVRATFHSITAKLLQEHRVRMHARFVKDTKIYYDVYFPSYQREESEQRQRHDREREQCGWRELEQLVKRQEQEQKDLHNAFFSRQLSVSRSAYSEEFAEWKALREKIYAECQDYYDACSPMIRALDSAHRAENRYMNWLRAMDVHTALWPIWSLHISKEEVLRGELELVGNAFQPPFLDDKEKKFIEPGLPQARQPHWRIPSSPVSDDPLYPLTPPILEGHEPAPGEPPLVFYPMPKGSADQAPTPATEEKPDPLFPLTPDPLAPLTPDPLAPLTPPSKSSPSGRPTKGKP